MERRDVADIDPGLEDPDLLVLEDDLVVVGRGGHPVQLVGVHGRSRLRVVLQPDPKATPIG